MRHAHKKLAVFLAWAVNDESSGVADCSIIIIMDPKGYLALLFQSNKSRVGEWMKGKNDLSLGGAVKVDPSARRLTRNSQCESCESASCTGPFLW